MISESNGDFSINNIIPPVIETETTETTIEKTVTFTEQDTQTVTVEKTQTITINNTATVTKKSEAGSLSVFGFSLVVGLAIFATFHRRKNVKSTELDMTL